MNSCSGVFNGFVKLSKLITLERYKDIRQFAQDLKLKGG